MKTTIKNTFLYATLILIFAACEAPEPDDITTPTIRNITVDEIYFYSRRAGIYNIYKVDNSGVETPIIIDNEHHDWWVRVSPNKQTILWYKSPKNVPENQQYNNYKAAELWMANADGTNPRKVIDLEDYNWTEQGVADWSPDGSQIVMIAEDESGHFQIYITDAEGKNPQRISQRNSLYADPSWSPDGSKIVYTAFPEGYIGVNFFKLEVHTMNPDGTDETRLTFDELRDHDPYWSPDGKEIAFESQWSLANWAIRKVNLQTGETIDVLKDDKTQSVPRWTQNSQELYFVRFVLGEFVKLVKCDRDGNNLETVLASDEHNYLDCDLVEF